MFKKMTAGLENTLLADNQSSFSIFANNVNRIKNSSDRILLKNSGYFPLLIKDPKSENILMFYRSGAGHLGKSGKISALSMQGKEITKLGSIIQGLTDLRNPAVFIDQEGQGLAAVYKYDAYYGAHGIADPYDQKASFQLLIYRSAEGLKNWQLQENTEICPPAKTYSPSGRIIQVQDKLILPIYDGKTYAAVLISKDQGKTWPKMHHIAFGYREPSITQAADGHLIATLRGNPNIIKSSATFISHSYDNGTYWTNPVPITNHHCHPADILKLTNGDLLITYSVRKYDEQRIVALLSRDHGQTWTINNPITLNKHIYINCDFGYPSTIESEPGKLITVFYTKPNVSARFDFSDPDNYDSTGLTCRILHYALAELYAVLGI